VRLSSQVVIWERPECERDLRHSFLHFLFSLRWSVWYFRPTAVIFTRRFANMAICKETIAIRAVRLIPTSRPSGTYGQARAWEFRIRYRMRDH